MIDVVYLLHESDGDGPVKKFCQNYKISQKNNFELIFIIKGKVDYILISEIKLMLADISYKLFYVKNIGMDIHSYCKWASLTKNNYCIFLNGHSYPLVENWLNILSMNDKNMNIGIKGATGSLASHASIFFSNKNKSNPTFFIKYIFLCILFKKYPNFHIRTNAFYVKKSLIDNMLYRVLSLTKIGCYFIESGRLSLTNRALRKNFTAQIVDRNGRHFDANTVHAGEFFFKGSQAGLIVADNQSNKYKLASLNEQEMLKKIAWGNDDKK